jgi:ATP-dependent Clp protease protease subunit
MDFDELFGEITITKLDEENAKRIREQILKVSRMDPQRPITIILDSYGGSVYAMATIVETMESVSNPFITVAVGKCMSAAAIILAAGDFRFAGHHSRIMVHEVSAGAGGHINDMETSIEDIRSLNEYWLNFLAKRCKRESSTEIKQVFAALGVRDLHMTPEQAKLFGLIDFIGMPDIKPIYYTQVATLPKKEYQDVASKSVDAEQPTEPESTEQSTTIKKKKKKKNPGAKRFIAKRNK